MIARKAEQKLLLIQDGKVLAILTVCNIGKTLVRIGIDAQKSVRVVRQEILHRGDAVDQEILRGMLPS